MARFKLTLTISVLFLIWLILTRGVSLYVDYLWFDSVGYLSVFITEMTSRAFFWLAGFLIALVVLGINLWIATRRSLGSYWLRPDLLELARSGSRWLFWLAALVLAALIGFAAQEQWLSLLRYRHMVPAQAADPIFGRDISFYFFSLPVLTYATHFALTLLAAAVLVVATSYVLHGHFGFGREGLEFTFPARLHITLLVALVFFVLSGRFWLSRFDLLYGQEGVLYGAGYADINGWIPGLWVLIFLSALTGVLVILSAFAKTGKYSILSGVLFLIAYFLVSFYPPLLQTFIVEPDELEKEKPYILNSIESTRRAYGLDRVQVREFSPSGTFSPDLAERHQETINNVRLWDWRPLMDAYNQLQSIRQYYGFQDVDIDRYVIDGNYRQVTLASRELEFNSLSPRAQTWINQFFQYTHGYGLVLSPVNEVTTEGLPQLFLQDIPPRSSVDLQVTRPEIYFGEKTDYPVFVKTAMQEFDYPMGDQNAYATYQGERGISISGFGRRLLFAWELGRREILLDNPLTEESRVLLHRHIQHRARKIAPFLFFDQDPYLVIDEGRLFWIQDAYTLSDRYPYSEPFSPSFNYIRNSVKIVTDAYLGDIQFYLADPTDPIIQTYSRIFPSLFKPLQDIPVGLKDNLRYPEDLFNVQRSMFRIYHMQDPTVFYNKEDVWEIPSEIYRGNEQTMDSYYVIMELPGSEGQEEFVLLIPFTPRNKNNMIAWLAARSDGDNYGKLVLYQFPKQELIYGPMQIEARIDQDPNISQLITLWSQKGSRVIRGNLLVIPIENTLLYVEPLYLQAEKSEIPELTRVILVHQNQVAMGESLQEALQMLFGKSPTPAPRTSESPPAPRPPAEMSREGAADPLVGRALEHYRRSQEFLKAGNWNGYGEEQRKLGEVLNELSAR